MVMSAIMKKKMPCALNKLPVGCRARISRVDGAGDIRARLSAMGLTPETDIEVLDCACGRQIVKVRGCSLVLDGETAGHVTCALEPIDGQEAAEACPACVKGSRS